MSEIDADNAVKVLESFYEEDHPGEQKEEWEKLKRALDEDRMSDRKLFPNETNRS